MQTSISLLLFSFKIQTRLLIPPLWEEYVVQYTHRHTHTGSNKQKKKMRHTWKLKCVCNRLNVNDVKISKWRLERHAGGFCWRCKVSVFLPCNRGVAVQGTVNLRPFPSPSIQSLCLPAATMLSIYSTFTSDINSLPRFACASCQIGNMHVCASVVRWPLGAACNQNTVDGYGILCFQPYVSGF